MRAASGAALSLVVDDVEVVRLPASPAEAAAAEATRDDDNRLTEEIAGKRFPLTDELNQFALLEYTEAANDGFTSEDGAGYAAILRFLDALVADDARQDFRRHCRANKVEAEDLVAFIGRAMKAIAGRPTVPSSPSGDGRQSDGPTSNAPASGSGAPDLRSLGIAPVDEVLKS